MEDKHERTQKAVIQKHFSEIDNYDTYAEHVVPKNDELHQIVISQVPLEAKKIIDLGSGTGHGLLLTHQRVPTAEIIGIDFSAKQNRICKTKLEKNNDTYYNILITEADFNEIPFERETDAVISVVAIHNSTHEQKKILFKKIYTSLKKGGVFINGDFTASNNPTIQKEYDAFYRNYLIDHLSGLELDAWIRHAFGEDKPAPLDEQKIWMEEAGFKEFRVLWKYENLAVYLVRK